MYSKFINYLKEKPSLYAPSSAPFWDDEHISEYMLKAHLDPEIDAATRLHDFIEQSAKWIAQYCKARPGMKLLDLGCGPGLYAERFCKEGFRVTGLDYSRRSIEQARQAMDDADRMFCVGTSLLNPAKPFMDLWYRVNRAFPNYKLHLVPFEDNHEGILSEIAQLGKKFDFLVGVCDSRLWMEKCSFLQLGRYKKMCAVSREHPLACKQNLDISDLYGETLMMVAEGDSGTNDFIRNDLNRNHPEIQIEDTPHFYDISVFNRCAGTCHHTGKLGIQHSLWASVSLESGGRYQAVCRCGERIDLTNRVFCLRNKESGKPDSRVRALSYYTIK